VPQPLLRRKKPAKPFRTAIVALAAVCVSASITAGPQRARAIVVPTPPPPPRNFPTSAQTPTPNSTILPLNSILFFVLDDKVSSHTRAGSIVRAHLRDPIVLDGVTIAAAGTPVRIEITQASAAQIGNVNGSLEMYFEGLPLANGKKLPLITPMAHVDPHMTAGQQSTRAITDTVGDIVIPGHVLYHYLRKGSDVTLNPGTVVAARTAATISIAHSAIAVSTPPPFVTVIDTPHPTFSVAPIYTPPGFQLPTPKPKPTVSPAATPSVQPSATP
jgi:hypothetical protein